MNFLSPVLAVALLAAAAAAESLPTEDVSIGFLPREWVNAALAKSLSPQGRASLVSATGPVRVTDTAERLEAVRGAIRRLQEAPALVPIEITFATLQQRVVQRLPVEPPVVERGIPIPNRYDPPRIIASPNGYTVIPAQPRDFTTRRVGPGDSVNIAPTGYRTLTPEVRLSETETATAQSRRLSASTVLGKPVLATILRQAPDAAALRALALKYRAIAEGEPAWTAAGTELQLTPELSGAAVMVKVVPQIVLPPAAPGQAPRRISLSACTAGVLVAPGATSQTGILPGTDPEFYRVFLGAAQAADDTFTAMTVTASAQYIGSPPQ